MVDVIGEKEFTVERFGEIAGAAAGIEPIAWE